MSIQKRAEKEYPVCQSIDHLIRFWTAFILFSYVAVAYAEGGKLLVVSQSQDQRENRRTFRVYDNGEGTDEKCSPKGCRSAPLHWSSIRMETLKKSIELAREGSLVSLPAPSCAEIIYSSVVATSEDGQSVQIVSAQGGDWNVNNTPAGMKVAKAFDFCLAGLGAGR